MPYQFDEHQHTQALVDFARGHYKNVTPVHLFGFNRTVATSFETIANDGGGVYTFPASAVVMTLVSDAADTCSVLLSGLDANWQKITETVVLTGTTPVNTTNSFFRLNSAIVMSGTQAGNVSITNNSVKYAHIEASTGVSQFAVYSTSENEALYINGVNFASGTVNPNKYLTGRIYQKTDGGSALRYWEATWSTSQIAYDVKVPFRIPPKTDISFQAKSSSGENEIAVYVNCFAVDNE